MRLLFMGLEGWDGRTPVQRPQAESERDPALLLYLSIYWYVLWACHLTITHHIRPFMVHTYTALACLHVHRPCR
jgi:hypothetical protein